MDVIQVILATAIGDGDDEPTLPPGSPPTRTFSSQPNSLDLTLPRQVRGSMVHNADLALLHHRSLIFPHLLLLSSAVALDVCTKNHAERHAVCLTYCIAGLTPSRLLPPRGTCSTGLFWLDYSNTQSL
jgi:hypothetical protein